MIPNLFTDPDFFNFFILIIVFLFVLFYEVINGFHDTANAVAIVVYTKSMKNKYAVIISGIFNFLGVFLGGLSVAYTILYLVPIDLLISINKISKFKYNELAMIFSMLFAAITWNLITWYLRLPASSSHTLIGSIIGVGITNAIITNQSIINAMNISKMTEILISLILSPFCGLIISSLLIIFMRFLSIKKKYEVLHITPKYRKEQDNKKQPPFWIRFFLIISAIGVSYSHGSNDGQKGIGLIMLVLIIMLPFNFILNINTTVHEIQNTKNSINYLEEYYNNKNSNFFNSINIKKINKKVFFPHEKINNNIDKKIIVENLKKLNILLKNINNYKNLNFSQRKKVYSLIKITGNTIDQTILLSNISKEETKLLKKIKNDLFKNIEYAPLWIVILVALALSLGTMIGWKRISNTISKNIGQQEITYAQGLSAQITSALSIGTASYIGMPVSTPYILSSSLAGAILADGNKIQYRTIKNILLAWFFTLPISIFIAALLYWLLIKLF